MKAILSAIGYSLCSSTLLLLNKGSLQYLPYGSLLSIIQFVISIIIILIIDFLGYDQIDRLEWKKVKYYLKYVILFIFTIYSNMKSLTTVNVETVIVFRSCSPIAVSIIEYLLLNRSFPSFKSLVSLIGVAAGAVVYCISDSQLKLEGLSAYSWVLIYFVLITTEMTYGKVIISSVKMDSIWGSVYYCAVLSLPLLLLIELFEGNLNNKLLAITSIPTTGWLVIGTSSIFAALIGYTGWLCRSLVSATSYTLIGVVNKFITVIMNVIFFQKHASNTGLLAVCLCLTFGTFYEQAPFRSPKNE
eukprot:gene2985-3172_t